MSEDRPCKICKSVLEPENPINICMRCQSIVTHIEMEIDGF